MTHIRAALLAAAVAATIAVGTHAATGAPASAAAAAKASALTSAVIEKLEASFTLDARNRALLNAMTNNDLKSLALNRELLMGRDDLFDVTIDAKGITDQAKSGRCWLFAGFNIMRPAVMKKYDLSEFEFSESYLFFWDKLEKANLFLEAIIETRDRDIDDRELQTLIKDPVPDGGWWSYVASLIGKYGVVPKRVMPETANSSNTGLMNVLLNRLARRDAAELRAMAAKGAKQDALEARRVAMLSDFYRILALTLGVPPKQFAWRYATKDGKIVEASYTPLSFYREVVGIDLAQYVSLFDHPIHPYDRYYRIRYCRSLADATDMDFVNVPASRFKSYALAALLAGEPVWFAADVGAENYGKDGFMMPGIYDFASLVGTELGLGKADRVWYQESTPNHAMVFVGVDTLAGRPVQWRVENSWGADAGNKGYWTMSDRWFDEYVYAVIVKKSLLPPEVLALLDTKPAVLPAWDPMRSFFNR